jgi:hypothetical protein
VSAAKIRLKASTFRSYVKLLVADGRLAEVRAQVPPDTQRMLDDPPLASTWMEWRHTEAMVLAIEKQWGTPAIRDYSRRSIAEMRGINLRIAEGILRIFGMSPATVYKKMNDSIRSLCEGMEYEYTSLGERVGRIEASYAEPVPDCVMLGTVASLEEILRICRVKGTVDGPKRLSPKSAEFHVSWS